MENRRMSTGNRSDLQALGSQPVIMPKINFPDHSGISILLYPEDVTTNSVLKLSAVESGIN